MKIENYIGARLIISESKQDDELLAKFSAALSAYDFDSTPTVQRTKLRALWLRVEYATKQTLHQSAGIKRSDVFDCREDD